MSHKPELPRQRYQGYIDCPDASNEAEWSSGATALLDSTGEDSLESHHCYAVALGDSEGSANYSPMQSHTPNVGLPNGLTDSHEATPERETESLQLPQEVPQEVADPREVTHPEVTEPTEVTDAKELTDCQRLTEPSRAVALSEVLHPEGEIPTESPEQQVEAPDVSDEGYVPLSRIHKISNSSGSSGGESQQSGSSEDIDMHRVPQVVMPDLPSDRSSVGSSSSIDRVPRVVSVRGHSISSEDPEEPETVEKDSSYEPIQLDSYDSSDYDRFVYSPNHSKVPLLMIPKVELRPDKKTPNLILN